MNDEGPFAIQCANTTFKSGGAAIGTIKMRSQFCLSRWWIPRGKATSSVYLLSPVHGFIYNLGILIGHSWCVVIRLNMNFCVCYRFRPLNYYPVAFLFLQLAHCKEGEYHLTDSPFECHLWPLFSYVFTLAQLLSQLSVLRFSVLFKCAHSQISWLLYFVVINFPQHDFHYLYRANSRQQSTILP